MNLKLATQDDLPEIIRLAEAFIAESPYADEGVPEDIEQTIKNILRDPTKGVIIFYMRDGKPAGFIGGILSKMLMSPALVATEVFWYVEPQYRGSRRSLSLKEAFEYWGKKMGAKFIAMSAIPNETVERYYERTGYRLQEKSYLKAVGG